MAKRKTLKQKTAICLAKHIREWKREMFESACKKGKVETYGDVIGVFYGLSRKAVELAAYDKIQMLASLGYSAAEIAERMEGKNKKARK
jgi:hypothetical protein